MFTSHPSSFFHPDLTTTPQIRIPELSRPSSIISSKMTDIASEDSHENNFQGSATNTRSPTGTQSGKAMSDRSRPPSAVSSQTRNSHRAQQSRRGLPLVGYNTGEPFGGPGGTMWNTSRPPSVTSRASRTHVPSLAAQAFFRPMSSQRLQARRGRQAETSHSEIPLENASEAGLTAIRHSLTSHPVKIIHHSTPVPPRSGGTEISDREDRVTMTASPNGETTVRGSGDSERPLQGNSFHLGPGHGTSASNYKQGSIVPPLNKNSPKSFRSKILSTPPENASDLHDNRGHERLPSKNSTSVKSDNTAPPTHGKNYQHFLGNTVFCFGGRFQNARDFPVNILSAIIAVLPTILFLFYSAPWVWHHVSPAIPILFAYISFICVSSLVHASVTDPGILPRNLHYLNSPAKSRDLTVNPDPPIEWRRMKHSGKGSRAMDIPVKYCKTCNIWRPPRCHHCRICDNCIDAQDHHCMWINNCVGRRNYRYFLAFLSSATILGLLLSAASLTHVFRYMSTNKLSFAQTIDELRAPFAMAIYGLLAFPYPACLWTYHIFLTGKSDTTREFLASQHFPKTERHTPYTNGSLIKNWVVAFLRPKPPSSMEFKQSWMVGDQRYGHFAMASAKDEGLPPPVTGKKRFGNQIELSTIGEDVNRTISRPTKVNV